MTSTISFLFTVLGTITLALGE